MHFVQLAQVLDLRKHVVTGQMLSEKLDGFRAIWDGGISRGRACTDVPWANVEKNARYKEVQYSTGLWTRYGNAVQAPDWFLDQLPVNIILDGELYAGRGLFQACRSTCSKLDPVDSEWDRISFAILDAPEPRNFFRDRTINDANYKKQLINCYEWVRQLGFDSVIPLEVQWTFQSTYNWLQRNLDLKSNLQLVEQTQLPYNTSKALEVIESRLEDVVSLGGEGLIIRKAASVWAPNRTYDCLKFKPYQDAEAVVKGYTWGRMTDKGSKLLGLMGALLVEFNGKRFELSGFTDEERQMAVIGKFHDPSEPYTKAGHAISANYGSAHFPIGSVVTFRYRELSDDGIPKEARYYRKAQ